MEKGIPLNAEKHIPIYKTTKETTEKLSSAHVILNIYLPCVRKKKSNFFCPLYLLYSCFYVLFFPHFNVIQVLHPQKGLL